MKEGPKPTLNPLARNETLQEKVTRFKVKFEELATSLSEISEAISSSTMTHGEIGVRMILPVTELRVRTKQLKQYTDRLGISSHLDALEQSDNEISGLLDQGSEPNAFIPFLENAKKAANALALQLEECET